MVVELNQIGNGPDIQSLLLEHSGQRTVPNVFVGGAHIGGNDDCHELYDSGELEKRLARANK